MKAKAVLSLEVWNVVIEEGGREATFLVVGNREDAFSEALILESRLDDPAVQDVLRRYLARAGALKKKAGGG